MWSIWAEKIIFHTFFGIFVYYNHFNIKGIKFEKDANGNNRYVRFDLNKYGDILRPLLKKLGVAKSDEQAPEGWEDALTSEEFFEKSKKILRRKFDERSKVW